MKRNPDTYQRAKWSILSRIISRFPDLIFESLECSWRMAVKPGDLVVLNCAPPSKWAISWVIDIDKDADRYGLASIEDMAMCNWSNVGMDIVKRFDQPECWRWTDRQFAFNDRWRRVCGGHYCVRDGGVTFDGMAVRIKTRSAFDHNLEVNMERAFPDWRKVKVSDMRALYDESVSRLASNRKSP